MMALPYLKYSRTGPYSLSPYMHLILNPAFVYRRIILDSTAWYSDTFWAWTKSHLQYLIFLDIVAKDGKWLIKNVSIHGSTSSCAAMSSLGISIISATTGVGVCHTVFPLRDAISGPKIFSARIMSSTVMGKSLIVFIFRMHWNT